MENDEEFKTLKEILFCLHIYFFERKFIFTLYHSNLFFHKLVFIGTQTLNPFPLYTSLNY